MTRVLMIDGDRALAQSAAMASVKQGVAICIAETLCEGVRSTCWRLRSPLCWPMPARSDCPAATITR